MWQDKPDSDGPWWVVWYGKVTLVEVELAKHYSVPLAVGTDEIFSVDQIDGPWMKAVPPVGPKGEAWQS